MFGPAAEVAVLLTSPPQPLGIKSNDQLPTPGNNSELQPSSYTLSIGTPNPQALRVQYAGTPPLPNIPICRTGTPTSQGGTTGGTSLTLLLLAPGTNTDLGSPLRPPMGGLSATRQNISSSDILVNTQPNMADLDGLQPEEKAKVLGHHLMAKVQRRKASDSVSKLVVGSVQDPNVATGLDISRNLLSGVLRDHGVEKEDSEPFHIPYNAHGTHVTYVFYLCPISFTIHLLSSYNIYK